MEPTETSKAQQTEEAPNPMEITSESKENEAKSLPEQKHHGPPTPTASSSYVWDGNTTLDVTESTLEGEKLMQILSNNKHSTVKCEALLQDFGRDGARKLASAIEKNNSVTSLEIDSCDFGDGGLFYLTEAIAARPDVTSLMLRGLLQKGQVLPVCIRLTQHTHTQHEHSRRILSDVSNQTMTFEIPEQLILRVL